MREGMERAKAMARKAIELDDTLAEAHTSLGWVTFVYDWDWPAAAIRFERAIELNPSYSVARQWRSWFLIAMGRTDAALAEGRIAAELDPASVSIRRVGSPMRRRRNGVIMPMGSPLWGPGEAVFSDGYCWSVLFVAARGEKV